MIRAFVLSLLLTTTPAMAQTTKMGWQEDFQVGQNVDLSQGFYVCGSKPADALHQLIGIEDAQARYRRATTLTCPILQLVDKPAVFRVVAVNDHVCLGQHVEEGWTICEREGHQLTIRLPDGRERTVLWISLDWDVD